MRKQLEPTLRTDYTMICRLHVHFGMFVAVCLGRFEVFVYYDLKLWANHRRCVWTVLGPRWNIYGYVHKNEWRVVNLFMWFWLCQFHVRINYLSLTLVVNNAKSFDAGWNMHTFCGVLGNSQHLVVCLVTKRILDWILCIKWDCL